MTISSPTFTRLQDGIKSVDDLRVRGPVNAAIAWLGGDLVTQLNTHFGAVSTSISAALATFLATANTWTAAQTTQLTAAGTALTLQSTDAGAGQGPDILLDRASATPAANDFIGNVVWRMRDTAGNATFAAQILGQILDPADASEDAQLTVWTMINGSAVQVMLIGNGVQIGGPTGGYQGVGTLNLDNALYKDGTQVVSSRVTGYGDPFGAVSRATISVTTVTTAALASFVAAMYADLKAHGLIGN
jgi:hypothetical protein